MNKQLLFLMVLCIWLMALTACQDDPTPEVERQNDVLKIVVEQPGLYAISAADLQALNPSLASLEVSQLKLTEQGTAVPYWLTADQLLFYGQAADDIYTAERTYLLEIGQAGQLMSEKTVSAALKAPLTTIQRPVWLEENHVYVSQAYSLEQPDTWYWHTIHVQQLFEFMAELEGVASGAGEISFQFYGTSHDSNATPDHDLDFWLNDTLQTTISWDGPVHHQTTITLPTGALVNGSNRFKLDNTPAGQAFVDIMEFNHARLVYEALPQTSRDQLHFIGQEGLIKLNGFSSTPLVLDITNPAQPLVLTGWTGQNGQVDLPTTAGQELLVTAPAAYQKPAELTGLQTSTLTNPENQADLIIITTHELQPAVQPLVQARQEQGLNVVVATVGEIYDHFGFGAQSPQAIQNFLTYASQQWQAPAPRYVLLVGDATTDYRNFQGGLPAQHVPAFMVQVTHSGETVSDARLADVNGDFRPDLAIGRWPVSDLAQVESLVSRTLAYESNPVSSQALFTADGTSAEFSGLSDELLSEANFPAGQAIKLYGASADEVTTAWNNGTWLVNYVGHGSLNLWGKESVFNVEHVANLQSSNTAAPIVLQFTCLTGFFAHPTNPSLSEQLLLSPHGPVILIAASSLTLSSHQKPFALAFLQGLQNPELTRVGDVLQQAKLGLDVTDIGLREISDTFGLVGDPSALVRRP